MLIQPPHETNHLYRVLAIELHSGLLGLNDLEKTDYLLNIKSILAGENEEQAVTHKESKLSFYSLLAYHLSDISDTFETLSEITRMFSARPKLPKEISTDRFRKFLYESFFENIYIFHQRYTTFIKDLVKEFQYDSDLTKFRVAITELKNAHIENFSKIIEVRGSHIHKRRLSNSIYEFNRIQFMEAFNSKNSPINVSSRLRKARAASHSVSKKALRDGTHMCKISLKGISMIMLLALVDEDGRLRTPRKYKTEQGAAANP